MMSFNDNDYDEVRDERESKTFRVIRGCFKGLLYGASALVWILILVTVFTTRESKIYKQMMFTEATESVAKTTEDYEVLQVIISGFMNDQGDISLSSNTCYYAKETGELTLGLRYNKKLTDSDTKDSLLYVMQDQNGNEYPAVVLSEDEIGRYGYARVCFTGIPLPIDDEENEFSLTLTLYRSSDGELLSTYTTKDGDEVVEVNDSVFTIYNAQSTCRMTDYED